eukprot:NODE_11630_length_1274_cov_5.694856.p2 GENE.NODE_11630_length_1274_cov_5.694856~~NODE_11630_length_1274_cov_5.694856.p2  ORF type:complete len:202 (+),score=48.05 NODE_11630_length_1274_cov_5.694856:353-958(+)
MSATCGQQCATTRCPLMDAPTEPSEPSETTGSQCAGKEPCILHVYDVLRITRLAGVPLYHLGIEVYGREYFYSVSGVGYCVPGGHRWHVHKHTLSLGNTLLNSEEVDEILENMCTTWGHSYNILARNCQTFAVHLCELLGLGGAAVPTRYCRLASLSGWRNAGITSVGTRLAWLLQSRRHDYQPGSSAATESASQQLGTVS